MRPLSENEKKELIALIESGNPLPEKWHNRLFPGTTRPIEIGKEYRLVYDGKMRREEVLAQTPAAPWQAAKDLEEDEGSGSYKYCVLPICRAVSNLSVSITLHAVARLDGKEETVVSKTYHCLSCLSYVRRGKGH